MFDSLKSLKQKYSQSTLSSTLRALRVFNPSWFDGVFNTIKQSPAQQDLLAVQLNQNDGKTITNSENPAKAEARELESNESLKQLPNADGSSITASKSSTTKIVVSNKESETEDDNVKPVLDDSGSTSEQATSADNMMNQNLLLPVDYERNLPSEPNVDIVTSDQEPSTSSENTEPTSAKTFSVERNLLVDSNQKPESMKEESLPEEKVTLSQPITDHPAHESMKEESLPEEKVILQQPITNHPAHETMKEESLPKEKVILQQPITDHPAHETMDQFHPSITQIDEIVHLSEEKVILQQPITDHPAHESMDQIHPTITKIDEIIHLSEEKVILQQPITNQIDEIVHLQRNLLVESPQLQKPIETEDPSIDQKHGIYIDGFDSSAVKIASPDLEPAEVVSRNMNEAVTNLRLRGSALVRSDSENIPSKLAFNAFVPITTSFGPGIISSATSFSMKFGLNSIFSALKNVPITNIERGLIEVVATEPTKLSSVAVSAGLSIPTMTIATIPIGAMVNIYLGNKTANIWINSGVELAFSGVTAATSLYLAPIISPLAVMASLATLGTIINLSGLKESAKASLEVLFTATNQEEDSIKQENTPMLRGSNNVVESMIVTEQKEGIKTMLRGGNNISESKMIAEQEDNIKTPMLRGNSEIKPVKTDSSESEDSQSHFARFSNFLQLFSFNHLNQDTPNPISPDGELTLLGAES